MQTTMTFDWAVIVTALAPTLAIIVAAVIADRKYRRIRQEDKEERARIARLAADTAAEIKKQNADTHVLVNDQLTREKVTRLMGVRTNRALLQKLVGDDPTEEEKMLLEGLTRQADNLAAEIRQRDLAAGTLLPDTDAGGGP